MATLPFFPDYASFCVWIQRIPGVFPCRDNSTDPRLQDPRDPCYSHTEGPYYLAPEYLLLRVGSGASARYNVLVRVENEVEADYRWYVSAFQPGQDGEIVFAAFLWDQRKKPAQIVGGGTVRKARAALEAFLVEKLECEKRTVQLPFIKE